MTFVARFAAATIALVVCGAKNFNLAGQRD